MSLKWRIGLIVILLAILAAVFLRSPSRKLLDFTTPATDHKHYPIAYLTHIKTTQLNAAGGVAHVLTADKISYFGDMENSQGDTYALLDKPFITIYNKDPNALPWLVSAARGTSTNNGQEILLEGNVVLQQKNKQLTVSVITSEQLLVKPDQQYAETSKPVMIKSASNTMNATGLKLFLESSQIELLAKVRGRYDTL